MSASFRLCSICEAALKNANTQLTTLGRDVHVRQIIGETFVPTTYERSKRKIRVRPMKGQGFASDVRIKFSLELRDRVPVGTLFKVWVSTDDNWDTRFLRSSGQPVKIAREDALLFISEHSDDVWE